MVSAGCIDDRQANSCASAGDHPLSVLCSDTFWFLSRQVAENTPAGDQQSILPDESSSNLQYVSDEHSDPILLPSIQIRVPWEDCTIGDVLSGRSLLHVA